MDLAGLEPTASALQVRCSPVLSYRPRVPPPWLASGYSITPGAGVNSSQAAVAGPPFPTEKTPSPKQKKRARDGPQQIESNESSPCLRNSDIEHNDEASVPPLRAGVESQEMEARVDCGYADPPCVSALLCRCKAALWSDCSRHPVRWRSPDTMIRRRDAWLRPADRDCYAIG